MYGNTGRGILALANGEVFQGVHLGAKQTRVGELVFHTSLAGYQEILTDPSFTEQLITFTAMSVGNTGINCIDAESAHIQALGVIVNQTPVLAQHRYMHMDLPTYLSAQHCPGLAKVDTRQITHTLRTQGAMAACLTHELSSLEAVAAACTYEGMVAKNLAKKISTTVAYVWDQGLYGQTAHKLANAPLVVVYDLGVKHSILRHLVHQGFQVLVVPYHTTLTVLLALKPAAVVFSNGPGDPAACTEILPVITALLAQQIPVLGICLGHQLLALALGASTTKMPFGHRGANHPVQDLHTRRVLITSQNHGFAVSDHDLPRTLTITHRSLFDGTIQGLQHISAPAMGFQGHPEAAPGPNDAAVIFETFAAKVLNRT